MAPKRNTAPTMKDVASEAGVALFTVSKLFNNLPVRDEYREKVLTIRSLSSGRLSATPSLLTCPMP